MQSWGTMVISFVIWTMLFFWLEDDFLVHRLIHGVFCLDSQMLVVTIMLLGKLNIEPLLPSLPNPPSQHHNSQVSGEVEPTTSATLLLLTLPLSQPYSSFIHCVRSDDTYLYLKSYVFLFQSIFFSRIFLLFISWLWSLCSVSYTLWASEQILCNFKSFRAKACHSGFSLT